MRMHKFDQCSLEKHFNEQTWKQVHKLSLINKKHQM